MLASTLLVTVRKVELVNMFSTFILNFNSLYDDRHTPRLYVQSVSPLITYHY